MALAKSVDKNCTTCYWMQFRIKDGVKALNRTCQTPIAIKQSLDDDQSCLNWRIDPDVKNRPKGFAAYTTATSAEIAQANRIMQGGSR